MCGLGDSPFDMAKRAQVIACKWGRVANDSRTFLIDNVENVGYR